MRSLFILVISILCFTISLNSQWQPDLRLTYDASESATSLNYARCIASCQDTLHVVWYDGRNGVSQFYYKRSIDGGITWGADTRLSNSTSYAERGGIAVSGQTVHVVWQDWRNPSWEIYYKRSMDGGLSWGPDTRLTNADGNSWAPCVFVSGLMVNVCWTETRDGNVEVYYKRSPDGGISWGQDIRLTNDTAQSWYPSIAVSGLIVHVFWSDLRNNNYEIYYKKVC